MVAEYILFIIAVIGIGFAIGKAANRDRGNAWGGGRMSGPVEVIVTKVSLGNNRNSMWNGGGWM